MENNKNKVEINNRFKIIITILSVISIAVISIIIVYLVKQTQATATGAIEQQNLQQNNNENIQEIINITDLESVANKTEEELSELNEKEIEKNKTEEKKNNTTKTKNKYYIKVNYGAQVVNIYTYDKNGEYTVPVKTFVCSTGRLTPTSGVYKIPAKIEWCLMIGDVYGHYCTQIVGDILFHSVPYLEKNTHSLEYWEYDKLGTKASLGCIRLTTRDAKWIFDNVSYGTQVEFYSSSEPGPLGKPTAQKISDAPEELRGWDPTDPSSDNPWKTYKPEEDNKEKNQVNSENSNNIVNDENNVVENTESNNVIEENVTNDEMENDVAGNEQLDNTINSEQSNATENNVVEDNEVDKEEINPDDSQENNDLKEDEEDGSTDIEETEGNKKQEDTMDNPINVNNLQQ